MISGLTTLGQMLVEDLDPDFLQRLHKQMLPTWETAKGRSIDDKHIHEALKPYAFGQDRYYLVQSMFLNVGAEFGYQSDVVPCEKNGYPIPTVVINRFIFTTHFAFRPTEKFIQNSSFTRQQNALINNKYLTRDQLNLFDERQFDEKEIASASEIRANILFGCGGKGLDFQNFGFMRIGIPSVEPAKIKGREDKVWLVENHNYMDIWAMAKDRKNAEVATPIIKVATPKVKTATAE